MTTQSPSTPDRLPDAGAPQPSPVLRMAAKAQAMPGYLLGFTQPCTIFELAAGREVAPEKLAAADAAVRAHFGEAPAPHAPLCADLRVSHASHWTSMILRGHTHPVLDEPHAFALNTGPQPLWRVLQPCLEFSACVAAMEAALHVIDRLPEVDASDRESLRRLVTQGIEGRLTRLRTGALDGFNAVHFLKAAHDMGIPWLRVHRNTMMFGVGAASRLLDSSFTDRTSVISSGFARAKPRAARVLRGAGIPVPAHFVAQSADEAVACAAKLGYPVVVKPGDLDGGVGVSAFLQDADAVRSAFRRAAAKSKMILVEKHVEGKDYRIQVVDGCVQGVLERSPGSVTGDGRHTVAELVARQNAERAQATDDRRYLHAIDLDAEADAMLASAGMTVASVPDEGRVVRLRGASNVASGGVPRLVPEDEIHPDNAELAVRAARVLRLDVAGIDLLMPDIRKSWLETTAAICEVNAKPQMFTTMHAPMLRKLFRGGNGRVPVVVVVAAAPGEAVSAELHERLRQQHSSCGLVNAREVKLGARKALAEHPGTFYASRALMLDPVLDALVIAVEDDEVRKHGWPVDRCDALVLAGGAEGVAASDSFATLCAMAKDLRARATFVDATHPRCVSAAAMFAPARTIAGDGSRAGASRALADSVADWLGSPRA